MGICHTAGHMRTPRTRRARAGKLFAWGGGLHGKLGLGDAANHLVPTRVKALRAERVTQCAAGLAHSVAVTESGHVMTWGSAAAGRQTMGVA